MPTTWTAQFVEPVEGPDDRRFQRPAHHLAAEVHLAGPARSATLHVTARGVHETFVNGTRVHAAELLPGFTAYRKRLQVHSFDVTSMLREGANAVGSLLSDGWWRSQHSSARQTDSYGTTVGLLLELHVLLESGDLVVWGTGEGWLSTPSHILGADLIAGEVHDHRRRVTDWAEPGADRSSWAAVRVAEDGFDALCPASGPDTRRVQELPALSVRELAPGRHLADFGQNSNGWIRLTDLGPAGTTITLVHGEALDAAGDVTQAAISHQREHPDRPFQTDIVTSAGDDSTFEPRHSTKGFRYVRIEGHPGPLDPAALTSVVVHSDFRRTGDFSCSDDRINRLHVAADWSFRTNACGIPTDCPQRERAGWTGDWQLFVHTAAYLYDVHAFSARWLLDLAAEQLTDGTVLNMVPDPHDWDLPESAQWLAAQGSAGWGDAVCHVPYELHLATGRYDIAETHLPAMQAWVDRCADRAATARHPDRIAGRPTPRPHEQHLLDTGFHFGEWTEPPAPGEEADPRGAFARVLTMDHGPTATAYLHRSAAELATLAAVAGRSDTAARYTHLAARVLEAWRTEFIDADGHIQPQTQANLVRALAFGLAPAAVRQTAVADLVALIRAADTHLRTGFLATPFLLPVLADHGHLDLAYELLFQDTNPSWLAMIDQGATTIAEEWDGYESGRGSLNHYSKGAVVTFLHRYVAGLQIVEPGYRRFRVAPRPGGGITAARTYHESPHGRIEVDWTLDGISGQVNVVVPPGTTADLHLPDGSTTSIAPGAHRRTWTAPHEGTRT